MTNTRAFTLIELMIALTLGMLVIYTAFAAFRVAASATTASQRLATENALLRIAVDASVNEVDFWLASDDPDPTAPVTARPLRTADAGGGKPFTDFRDVGFVDSNGASGDWGGIMGDRRRGWCASPLAWSAADPRTWCRTNVAEESWPRSYWGHFGIYSHLDWSRAPHTWHAQQIRGLVDALGFYGLFDYLPSNGFTVYHSSNATMGKTPKGASTNLTFGGIPEAFISNGNWICASDGGDNTMKGRIRNTNGSRYYLQSPQFPSSAEARKLAKIGYEARDAETVDGIAMGVNDPRRIEHFLNHTRTSLELMRRDGVLTAPSNWPEVTYRVHRFIERGHPVALCVVEMTSPLTGAQLALPFTAIGTTLRGARQQRRPGSGWADPFSKIASERATLDYVDTP